MAPSNKRLWSVLLPAMVLPFIAALFYFVLLKDHPLAKALYVFTKIFTLVWPLVAVRWILKEPWPRPDFRGLKDGRILFAGLASGLLISAVGFALMQTPIGTMAHASADQIRAKTRDLGVLNYYWTFGVFICLFHSLLEEYYWRWFVYGKLRRLLPQSAAHPVAALAFTAHHVVIASQYFPFGWAILLGGSVGIGGALWSWMYERQQSLIGPWLSHILADAAIFVIGYQILF